MIIDGARTAGREGLPLPRLVPLVAPTGHTVGWVVRRRAEAGKPWQADVLVGAPVMPLIVGQQVPQCELLCVQQAVALDVHAATVVAQLVALERGAPDPISPRAGKRCVMALVPG